MKFFTFIADAFRDREGGTSSKRIGMYILLGYLGMIVKQSLNGGIINEYVLYTIGILILFFGGFITSEFFKDGDNFLKPKK